MARHFIKQPIESFKSKTGVAFDAIGASATAADFTLGLLLHYERANRLSQQKAMSAANLGFKAVLDNLMQQVFYDTKTSSAYEEAISQTVQHRTLQHLFNLALHSQARPQVKAEVYAAVNGLKDEIKNASDPFVQQLNREIEKFLDDPEEYKPQMAPTIPDGSPIGSFQCSHNQH